MIVADYHIVDEFSLKGEPFIVLVDYEKKNWLLFPIHHGQISGLWVNFPSFQLFKPYKSTEEVTLEFRSLSQEIILDRMKKAQQELFYGNSYLLNYTCSVPLIGNYDLKSLFHVAKASYKILLHNEFLCFSPEKFIEIEDDFIRTYPMKGTKLNKKPSDKEDLLNDAKEIAEHYTVVDLLRNDLGMVSVDIQVKKFRFISEIKKSNGTLLQVSSEIEGKICSEYRGKIGSILNALLPAGSISGAPKKKTLEIIEENELHQRGFYTGIAGYFDGKNFDSCVMIRFIQQTKEGYIYKTGVGLTHMSDLHKEIEELYQKIYVPLD